MKRIVFKKSLLIIKTLCLSLLLYLVTSATYENAYSQIAIANFMKKGVYSEELSTPLTKIYIVPRETTYVKPAYTANQLTLRPGSAGDILISLDSPFPQIPIVHQLMSYFIGGHSALKADVYDDFRYTIGENDIIDVTGLSDLEEFNVVTNDDGIYWMNPEYRKRFIGLRVKCSEEQRKVAINTLISYFDDPYNYWFVLNTKNSHYCSDLISKAYKEAGVDLNKDKLGTTVHDLLVSKNTYIFMYKYTDNDYVDHIYYIDDRE